MDYKKKYLKYKLKYLTAKKAFKGGEEMTVEELKLLKSPKGTFNYITKKQLGIRKKLEMNLTKKQQVNNLFILIKQHVEWHIRTVKLAQMLMVDEETAKEAARLTFFTLPKKDDIFVSELKESLKNDKINFKEVHNRFDVWIKTLSEEKAEEVKQAYKDLIPSEWMPEKDGDN